MPTTPPAKRLSRRTPLAATTLDVSATATPTKQRTVMSSKTPTTGSAAAPKERRHAEHLQWMEERRRAKERLARQQRIKQRAWIGGILLIVALIVWFVVSGNTTTHRYAGAINGVVTYANLSRNHVQGQVTYAQNPPVGGNHNPVWLNCGIYLTPVSNENAVHSLEHGSVWITYQPSLPSTSVAQLAHLVGGHDHAILSPYPGLPAPVVVSAWGVQLPVTSASDPRLGQFLSKYENSPDAPEPGGPCTDGTGSPTS